MKLSCLKTKLLKVIYTCAPRNNKFSTFWKLLITWIKFGACRLSVPFFRRRYPLFLQNCTFVDFKQTFCCLIANEWNCSKKFSWKFGVWLVCEVSPTGLCLKLSSGCRGRVPAEPQPLPPPRPITVHHSSRPIAAQARHGLSNKALRLAPPLDIYIKNTLKFFFIPFKKVPTVKNIYIKIYIYILIYTKSCSIISI